MKTLFHQPPSNSGSRNQFYSPDQRYLSVPKIKPRTSHTTTQPLSYSPATHPLRNPWSAVSSPIAQTGQSTPETESVTAIPLSGSHITGAQGWGQSLCALVPPAIDSTLVGLRFRSCGQCRTILGFFKCLQCTFIPRHIAFMTI